MTVVLEAPVTDLTQPLPYATFAITASRAAQLAAEGEMVPWQGVLAVEGVPTGDRRVIEIGALRWANLPLPLMAQFENPVGGMGHDGAVLAGRIDDIVRIDNNRVWARGFIDPKSPGGLTLVNALDMGLMRGVSVDLDDVTVTQFRDDDGKQQRGITNGRIRGATVTPFQAIVEAEISLDIDALAASGGDAKGRLARISTPISAEETIIDHLASSLVASGKIPTDPPLSFFEKRKFTELTPVKILPNGQVFGHIAAWGTCHISFRKCEPVPRSGTNYSEFRTGTVLTSDGIEVRTGPLIMDTVHPDLMMRASDAQAFYAHTGSAVADIVPYEDKFGIAIVGAVRPDVTPEQLRALRGSDFSPDWRTVNGRHRECVAMLAVNNSGFKVPQSLVASAGGPQRFVAPGGVAAALNPDGEVLALVAAGGALAIDPGCDDDDIDIDEMAATIDRDAALALIVQRWGPKVRTFRAATPRRVRLFGAGRAEFHAQHDQKTHGNRGGRKMPSAETIIEHADNQMDRLHRRGLSQQPPDPKKKPTGGGKYSTDRTADGRNYSGRPVLSDRALLQNSTRLTGPLWQVNKHPGEAYEVPDGYDVVETTSGRQRAYIRPTGKIVEANRTRPSLFEFDMFEAATVARTGDDGKSAVYAEPGKFIQKMYTNSELVKLEREFALAEFHAQHNQKTHGNRHGASSFDPETPTGYQDADIEAAGLEASANAAQAVMDPNAKGLDKKAKSRAAQSAADAAYHGGSLWDATTTAVADTGKKVSPEEFDDIMLEASGILHSRQQTEERIRRRGLRARRFTVTRTD